MVSFLTIQMVANVAKLLLALTATTNELMSVIFSPVNSSFVKCSAQVAPGGRDTANLRTNTIKCMLYRFHVYIYMVFSCIICWSDRPSDGFNVILIFGICNVYID